MVELTLFYLIAFVMVAAACAMITTKDPAKAALFLALAFFFCSFQWILLQAEFLALALIFVYVGAVMTLFLFVIMMLNLNFSQLKPSFLRVAPVALVLMMGLAWMMIHVIDASHLNLSPGAQVSSLSNTEVLGQLLYGPYLYSFELAAIILLIAIVGSISLVLVGKRKSTKSQAMNKQHSVTKQERLRIIRSTDNHRLSEES